MSLSPTMLAEQPKKETTFTVVPPAVIVAPGARKPEKSVGLLSWTVVEFEAETVPVPEYVGVLTVAPL